MTAPRPRRNRRPVVSEECQAWLRGEASSWEFFHIEPLAQTWADHGDRIVAEHVRDHPGTRPIRWWEYAAPEPRLRLGGRGTPLHEVSAYALNLVRGIPAYWRQYGDAFTLGEPIDPLDPPVFEGEGAYLKRLGLLLPRERPGRLSLAPEAVRLEARW